jgi:hypothetical protein
MQSKRKNGSRNMRRNDVKLEKQTHRVYIGWKQQDKKGAFKIIPINKGGGTQILDVPKKYIQRDDKYNMQLLLPWWFKSVAGTHLVRS